MAFLLHEPFHTRRRTEAQARADIRLAELQRQWHREGWRPCPDHHGKGCVECGGGGEIKLSFFDWLDERDEHGRRITRSAAE